MAAHDSVTDHAPPHFHAEYAGERVSLEIRSLAVLEGRIQRRALGMVVEWAADTSRSSRRTGSAPRTGQPLFEISPHSMDRHAASRPRALSARARELDLPIRAGLHAGEVEVSEDDVAGLAVHIGARCQPCVGG
jgi:class 3 adenylate cyclase